MTKFEEELSSLPVSKSTNYTEYWNKAQLLSVFKDWKPQQALPVVPECVGNMIEYAKKTEKTIRWFFTEDAYMFPEAMDWYAGSVKGLVDDIYGERQYSLINAFITGKYEVEKQQLFYLKNKMTGRALYYQNINGEKVFNETHFDSRERYSTFITKFTQAEIDSMNTGSYEQIEVTE